jgi:hypothetical protein
MDKLPENPVLEPYAISVKQAAYLEDSCESEIYNRLSRGEYVAFKDGRRTKILYQSIKERRANKLKPATFKNYGKAPVS